MTYRDFHPRTIRRTFTGTATIEYRNTGTRTSPRYVEGLAVPYRTFTDIGPYREQIWESCFVESLIEDPNLPLLLFHDTRQLPIGIAQTWTHKHDGLYARWTLDTSDVATEAARLASIGALRLSIGFQPEPGGGSDYTTDANGDLWVTRLKARLLEVSLTPTPAYPGAKVTATT